MRLFAPDKYQKNHPDFDHVVGSADRRKVSDVLSEWYGKNLSRDAKVFQAGGAEINSNNFRVEVNNQRLLVKRVNKSTCSEQQVLLKQKLKLYDWLRSQDIPVPTVHENKSLELLNFYSGAYWCVMEFIEGTYFTGADHEIEEAAQVTERLFQGLGNAPTDFVPVADSVEITCQELVTQVENCKKEWKSHLGYETETILSKEWETVKLSVDKCVKQRSATNNKTSLCHIDLHPHNLLFTESRISAILDFESFRMASRPVMVSFSAYKLLRQAVALAWSNGNHVCPLALVDKYRSSLSNPKFLPVHAGAFAKGEILRRLFLILDGIIIKKDQEAKKWLGDVPMHLDALHEVQLLFPADN